MVETGFFFASVILRRSSYWWAWQSVLLIPRYAYCLSCFYDCFILSVSLVDWEPTWTLHTPTKVTPGQCLRKDPAKRTRSACIGKYSTVSSTGQKWCECSAEFVNSPDLPMFYYFILTLFLATIWKNKSYQKFNMFSKIPRHGHDKGKLGHLWNIFLVPKQAIFWKN